MSRIVCIGSGKKTLRIGNHLPLFFMTGPCAMESVAMALDTAQEIAAISATLGVGAIYKTSFDKANRSSLHTKRGLGLHKALEVFARIRAETGLPVLTDVHTAEQCSIVAPYVDILQIPAFLCRQTDLLLAAAATNKPVSVKKGQFLAPWDMDNVVEKLSTGGARGVILTERGSCFGYNSLVNDFRALPIMAARTRAPVVFDATHSVQQPGALGGASGGQREFVPSLARAAVAVGVAGIFAETHPDPDKALSDGPNMIPLHLLAPFMKDLMALDVVAKSRPDLHGFAKEPAGIAPRQTVSGSSGAGLVGK